MLKQDLAEWWLGQGCWSRTFCDCEMAHQRKVELLWELVKILVPGPRLAH